MALRFRCPPHTHKNTLRCQGSCSWWMPLPSQPAGRSQLTLWLLPQHLWPLPDNICSLPEISVQHSRHTLPAPCPPAGPAPWPFEWERGCQSNGTGWINESLLATWPPLLNHPNSQHPEPAGPGSHAGREEGGESHIPKFAANFCVHRIHPAVLGTGHQGEKTECSQGTQSGSPG